VGTDTMSNTKQPKKWAMPLWMEPFRKLILNTGGNTIEDMKNDNTDPFINLPRSTLAACVKSQVGLLGVLYAQGVLSADEPNLLDAAKQGEELRRWICETVAKATYEFEELGNKDAFKKLSDAQFDGTLASYADAFIPAIEKATGEKS
jgi:hypothetical protein